VGALPGVGDLLLAPGVAESAGDEHARDGALQWPAADGADGVVAGRARPLHAVAAVRGSFRLSRRMVWQNLLNNMAHMYLLLS
jgi:hypothetical protein